MLGHPRQEPQANRMKWVGSRRNTGHRMIVREGDWGGGQSCKTKDRVQNPEKVEGTGLAHGWQSAERIGYSGRERTDRHKSDKNGEMRHWGAEGKRDTG